MCASDAVQLDEQYVLIVVWTGVVAFYVTHWRTYVTGKLFFRRCVLLGVCPCAHLTLARSFDVTEAQWIFITIHLTTAVFGPHVWHTDMLALLGLPYSMALNTFVVLASFASLS